MINNEFYELLERIKLDMLENHYDEISHISDIGFEVLFSDKLTKYLDELKSDIVVDYSEGSTKFPDIGCAPYGVEIKTTTSNKWVSLGNSIMEGTKRTDIEEIYVVFLKKGGEVDIRIKSLNESISDIKITHSPRYEINMDQKKEGIFEKMNTNYDEFSKNRNKIPHLRKYYKEKGSKSWWLDDEGENAVSMEIRSFSSLSKKEKEVYIVELFALFPQMLESEYEEAALYMITRHNIFDKSFRDKISAGGKVIYKIGIESFEVGKSMSNLLDALVSIISFLEDSQNVKLINDVWGSEYCNVIEIKEAWFKRSSDCIVKKGSLSTTELTLEEIALLQSDQELLDTSSLSLFS